MHLAARRFHGRGIGLQNAKESEKTDGRQSHSAHSLRASGDRAVAVRILIRCNFHAVQRSVGNSEEFVRAFGTRNQRHRVSGEFMSLE